MTGSTNQESLRDLGLELALQMFRTPAPTPCSGASELGIYERASQADAVVVSDGREECPVHSFSSSLFSDKAVCPQALEVG